MAAASVAPEVVAQDYGSGGNYAGYSASGYTYRDGYYWSNGVPYERYEGTCKKKECDHCGRSRWITYACWKYRPVKIINIKETDSFDDIVKQMIAMKREEKAVENDIRENYAKVKAVGELNSIFGFDSQRIQGYGQYLAYGDQYTQYPAPQGTTVYGVNEVIGSTYGESALSLLDADAHINTAYEHRRVSRQYEHDAEIALGNNVRDMEAGRTQQIGAVAEIQALGSQTVALAKELRALASELKAKDRATIHSREIFPIETHQPEPAEQPAASLPKWRDVVVTSCGECHIDQSLGKSDMFPSGFNFNAIGDMSNAQIDYLWKTVVTGKTAKGKIMPPKSHGPLTTAEKSALSNWLAGLSASAKE